MQRMGFRFIRVISKTWKQSARVLVKTSELVSPLKSYEKHNKAKNLYKLDDTAINRLRYLMSELQNQMAGSNQMDNYDIVPPAVVKGMTVLSKDAFTKKVYLPGFKIAKRNLGPTEKYWKKIQLKFRGIKAIAELGDTDPLKSTHCLMLLDPGKVSSISKEIKEILGFPDRELEHFEVEFKYENWSVPDIMRAVLPDDAENVSAFSIVGHIAHVNLKEWAIPYKYFIGQVVMDKVPTVKTVVNKLNQIDNTFRNFKMELLAGEDQFVTKVRENDCNFELDFSKVYWNPRLSTEHTRIINLIPVESVVYDVFAGIGPFAIPAGKRRRCKVFANDLNPSSFEYLQQNVKINKINGYGSVLCHNLDGRDFIKTTVKDDLIDRILHECENVNKNNSEESVCAEGLEDSIEQHKKSLSTTSEKEMKTETEIQKHPSTFIVMNLPGLAVEFLDAFVSLLHDLPTSAVSQKNIWASLLPMVYCYSFSPKTDHEDEEVKARVMSALGTELPADLSIRFVRNVSPSKNMVCLSFRIWPDLVLSPSCSAESASEIRDDEPECKRQKLASA